MFCFVISTNFESELHSMRDLIHGGANKLQSQDKVGLQKKKWIVGNFGGRDGGGLKGGRDMFDRMLLILI